MNRVHSPTFCPARLEWEGVRPECVGRIDSLGGVNLIAVRLVQILVSSLGALLTHDEQSPKNQAGLTAEDDGVNDAPKVMEVVDLLLSLSTALQHGSLAMTAEVLERSVQPRFQSRRRRLQLQDRAH
jgi:hypothetical protein